MKRAAVIAAVILAITSGGWKTHVITDRPGGVLVDHVAEFHGWYRRHDRVVIDGPCLSACTMVLGLVESICATKRGVLGFHSASLGLGGKYSEEGTRFMWFFYPQHVRLALANHGWPEPSEHPSLINIPAAEVLPLCTTKR